ncbi:sel1 repeat family protein [Desulfosarcina sp. OttesenSCG-928-A07]|nr:sel1 repeat family protein [Desulfosarcina sp. OttesenSCG-928-A07]
MTDYVHVPAKQVIVPNFSELQQAAKQGNAVSQYELGKLYAHGLGVPKNHKAAMAWWERAALQGYAPAQYSLGWMYFNGEGVITNFVKGCAWMQAAAAQGVQEAMNYYNEFCYR